jgi:hypothetical protein
MLSAPGPDLADAPTPDQARTLMTSLQQGWQRGRTEEIGRPGDEGPGGAGGPGGAAGQTGAAGQIEAGDGEAG